MCTGNLAAVSGKDKFPREALTEFTNFALECLEQKDSKFQLRETAISYFSEICKVLKSDMAPIFEKILNELGQSVASEDGIQMQDNSKAAGGFSLGSDSEDNEPAGITLDTNFIDEKSAAVAGLGNLALNCAGLMKPHMERLLKILGDILMYFHENIRYQVCLTYTQIAFGMMRLASGDPNNEAKFAWQAGLPPKQ